MNSQLTENTRIGVGVGALCALFAGVWTLAVMYEKREVRLAQAETAITKLEEHMAKSFDNFSLRLTALEISIRTCVSIPPSKPVADAGE